MNVKLHARALAGGALLASGLVACGSQGPYPVGLEVEGTSTVTQTVGEYMMSEGMSSPEARTGTVGFGPDCDVASASTGSSLETSELERTTTWAVVGETRTHHPLDPGEDGFGETWASIVDVTEVDSGVVTGTASYYQPGNVPEAWTEEYTRDIETATAADRFLVAADEYFVRMPRIEDVWSSTPSMELMTRRSPADGEMWPSLNGNFLYEFVGREDVDVGGRKVKADKVKVNAIGPIDASENQVLGECVRVGSGETSTQTPDQTDVTQLQQAYLDAGCIGDFTHLEVGTEWWYQGVLVKAERTVYQVEINEFGYEWYDTEGGGCRREVALTKDVPEAKLFVQYTLTEVQESYQATEWSD